MFEKEAKTVQEQIDKLKDRGLTILYVGLN